MHEAGVPVVVVRTAGEARVSILRLLDSGHADFDLIQRTTSAKSRAHKPGFLLPSISNEINDEIQYASQKRPALLLIHLNEPRRDQAWVPEQFPYDQLETEPGSSNKGRKTVDLTAYLCLQQVRKP